MPCASARRGFGAERLVVRVGAGRAGQRRSAVAHPERAELHAKGDDDVGVARLKDVVEGRVVDRHNRVVVELLRVAHGRDEDGGAPDGDAEEPHVEEFDNLARDGVCEGAGGREHPNVSCATTAGCGRAPVQRRRSAVWAVGWHMRLCSRRAGEDVDGAEGDTEGGSTRDVGARVVELDADREHAQ
eukprot:4694150-Prymnesium_polylepis.1